MNFVIDNIFWILVWIISVQGAYRLGKLLGWDEGVRDCSWIWGMSKDQTMTEIRRQTIWPQTGQTVKDRLHSRED
jgi:hypothetical protein